MRVENILSVPSLFEHLKSDIALVTVDYPYMLAEKGREKEGQVLNEILNFGIVGLIVSLANV